MFLLLSRGTQFWAKEMPSVFCSTKWCYNTTCCKQVLGIPRCSQLGQSATSSLSAVLVVPPYAVTFLVNSRAFLSRVTPKVLGDMGKLM